jgi:hypothetical protein
MLLLNIKYNAASLSFDPIVGAFGNWVVERAGKAHIKTPFQLGEPIAITWISRAHRKVMMMVMMID